MCIRDRDVLVNSEKWSLRTFVCIIFVVDYAVDNFLKSAKLAYTLQSTGDAITGIATLGDEVFVVRRCHPNIQVYKPNTNDLSFQRNVNVGAASNTFRGLAACEFNHCLYVSEQNSNAIHKVSPVTNSKVKQWSVNGQPFGVSVNLSLIHI